jgi:hypothetical protein
METVDLSAMSAKVVLRLYGSILAELARRKILTTNDNPIGGYGESLVARAFGGERQRNSSTGFDVLLPDGLRLQVKTRWLPLVGGLRQLSAIRKLESRGFDYVIAVLLDKNFDVAAAYQIPHAAVGRLATFAAHTNSHRLVMTPSVCRDPECADITEKLRSADLDSVGTAASRGVSEPAP